MNITRNNYEEFFMLYADNELAAAQRKDVEAFIAANTDLQHELALFQQFKLKPDAAVVFNNKELLMKRDAGQPGINIANYEPFFVLYADNELTGNEKAGVEDFVYRNPQLQKEFELLQEVKLSPDTSMIFENKESLYREEEDKRVVPFYWWRMAAAAAIVLFVSGLFWMNKEKKMDRPVAAVKNETVQPAKQPSIQKTTDTANQLNRNDRPAIAAVDGKKDNRQVKNVQAKRDVAIVPKKENQQNSHNLPVKEPERKETLAVVDKTESIKNTNLLNVQPKKVQAEKTLIAAAVTEMPDQPAILIHPEDNENEKAQYASFNSNDNVELLNTSVNTKSSLRGFLRKASRLIAKKTNGNEDSNRKSILIGGFEIAVR